jgi:hypothetical protein
MLLFLLEILERRTGALGLIPGALRLRRAVAVREDAEVPEKKTAKAKRTAEPATAGAARPAASPESKPEPPSSESALGDALKRARQRAKDRTGG